MESMGFGKKVRRLVTLAGIGMAAAGASDKATDEDVRSALNPGVNAPVATIQAAQPDFDLKTEIDKVTGNSILQEQMQQEPLPEPNETDGTVNPDMSPAEVEEIVPPAPVERVPEPPKYYRA